jgi:hypothetical protein
LPVSSLYLLAAPSVAEEVRAEEPEREQRIAELEQEVDRLLSPPVRRASVVARHGRQGCF